MRLMNLALAVLMIASGPLAAQDVNYSVDADVVYGHKDGMALTYDVFKPTENAKGVGLMFMVSGGWVSRWAEPTQAVRLFQPLIDRGYTVITVRHGSSPRYVIPEIAVDVRSALRHVHDHAKEFGIDPTRIGVFGFSAGGHLALLLGTQTNDRGSNDGSAPRVAAVVAVFPPTDLEPYVEPGNPLRERFPALQFDPEEASKYSPLMHVTSDDAPTLLVHGDQDQLVPIWHSEKISKALADVNVDHRMITIEGAAHGFDAEGNRRMIEGLLAWFDEHLVDPKK